MSNQVEILSEAIVEKGYRLTHARRVVIDCLVQSGGHISADDLVAQVHSIAPHVGRMTVFRTLELLTELGHVQPTYQGTGAAHYILMKEGSHHHLICTRCYQIIDFDDCMEKELAQMIGERFNFEVQSHLLEVHGLCEACQN
ncbi:MAG: transcriptional repressor [Caldilineaceae bacterium]|nr:transcriptional repressor [Caldilineaceae bacterium]